ncbi:putative ABC transporter ATP-binding protein YejF [Nymphon striatum]|nr:putative ABC transporter ATP-binding protein YejF [Nymphon striatum]
MAGSFGYGLGKALTCDRLCNLITPRGARAVTCKPLVDALTIGFGDAPPVVSDVSFSVAAGETLALVGESGSGKTLTCRTALRILPETAQIRGGSVTFNGGDGPVDLLGCPERQMRGIRGNRIAMIFQEPMRSLSPLHRLGNQVGEGLAPAPRHGRGRGKAARDRTI